MKKLLLLSLVLLTTLPIAAQQVIDEIIAVAGNEVVLRSELESQLQQLDITDHKELKDTKCWALEQLMMRKMLLSKAKADTLISVSEDQVDEELNRRIKFFAMQIGSERALEEYYGKSIVEMKEEFRSNVREQLLTDQMQNKILASTRVSPADVKKFYHSVHPDSLPLYSTEMEVAQIVRYPKIAKEQKDEAIAKLRSIRQDIINGASFGTKAIIFSQDNGSAIKGGELGMQHKNNYVPEFSAAAMKLKKDSISDVVESQFGYHIIQMLERRGEMINVRHILIKPEVTQESIEETKQFLDSLRNRIVNDTLEFIDAAYAYSEHEETKNMGGLLVDLKTNSAKVPVDELDPQVFFEVDKIKIGEVSEPVSFTTRDGRTAYRILYLKSKTPPHKANLKDDYAAIKELALSQKKQEALEAWFQKNIKDMYVRLNGEYSSCENLSKWVKESRLAEIGK